jgi:DNA-binding NtrC family response regulator
MDNALLVRVRRRVHDRQHQLHPTGGRHARCPPGHRELFFCGLTHRARKRSSRHCRGPVAYHRDVDDRGNRGSRTRSENVPVRRESSQRPHAWLFHVLSCDAPMAPLAGACDLNEVDEVSVGRGELGAATELDGDLRRLRLSFPDQWMSTRHARIERTVGGFWVADEGSKNGLLLNGERAVGALLVDGDWIEAGHTLLRYRAAALTPPRQPYDPRSGRAAVATMLPSLDAQSRDLEDIARSTVSVILHGETGTGKEVLARAVHRLSGRAGELIAVNCGALPAALLESELFGYRKGAFSNAVEDRPGLVRAADRGTLFLDEIGDLPPSSQAALLRVLQEREVTPLGGTRPVKVDLRVVSATHRDLEEQVALGQFRADLYARLSGHTFTIPPLRERIEDLGLLAAVLLRRIAPDQDLRFEPDAVRALYRHAWPLNVRELEKCLASAVVLARSGTIGVAQLPAAIGAYLTAGGATASAAPETVGARDTEVDPDPPKLRRVDRREQLVALLQTHRGNISAVARALGKARSQVQRWLHDYGLDPEHYRDK